MKTLIDYYKYNYTINRFNKYAKFINKSLIKYFKYKDVIKKLKFEIFDEYFSQLRVQSLGKIFNKIPSKESIMIVELYMPNIYDLLDNRLNNSYEVHNVLNIKIFNNIEKKSEILNIDNKHFELNVFTKVISNLSHEQELSKFRDFIRKVADKLQIFFIQDIDLYLKKIQLKT